MKILRKGNKKGFTLVEMLTVIAIIGILSGVVMVSSQGSVAKSKKASALTTAMSVLPELVSCQEDSGGIAGPDSSTNGGNIICRNPNPGGHVVEWPSLGNTGWYYSVTTGSFNFSIKKTGGTEADIVCNIAKGNCEQN